MAEGFARKYGSDVIEAASAGILSRFHCSTTHQESDGSQKYQPRKHFPKDLEHVPMSGFDIIVNISGKKLPTKMPMEVRDWEVDDPMGKEEQHYVVARDKIEHLVMRLILDLRKTAGPLPEHPGQRLPCAQSVRVALLVANDDKRRITCIRRVALSRRSPCHCGPMTFRRAAHEAPPNKNAVRHPRRNREPRL